MALPGSGCLPRQGKVGRQLSIQASEGEAQLALKAERALPLFIPACSVLLRLDGLKEDKLTHLLTAARR